MLIYVACWPLLAYLAGNLIPAIGSGDLSKVSSIIVKSLLVFLIQKTAQFGQDVYIAKPSLEISEVMRGNLFSKINIELIDFKIEFGKTVNDNENKLMLADEISPDNCRLWDKNTKKNFDKDIFRNNTGDLIEGYQEIVKRFELKIES